MADRTFVFAKKMIKNTPLYLNPIVLINYYTYEKVSSLKIVTKCALMGQQSVCTWRQQAISKHNGVHGVIFSAKFL